MIRQRRGMSSSCRPLPAALVFIRFVRPLWNSGDQVIVAPEAFAYNDSLRSDLVFADVFAMNAAAHLNHHYDFTKLTLDFDVTKPDNVVGEERDGIATEGQFRERLHHLQRAQNRDTDSGQRHDHAV